MNRRLTGMLVLALLLATPALAQIGDPDRAFAEARRLGFAGQRAEARALCLEILERSPGYTDVRVFLGRLHAWDRNYDEARAVLRPIVEAQPDSRDARSALVDVELWSDQPQAALELIDAGLVLAPGDAELRFKRVRALDKLGQGQQAEDEARGILEANPGQREARNYYRKAVEHRSRNKISLDYDIEDFDDGTESWHESSLAYRRGGRFGSIIGRVNYARRFGKNGTQFEIDAYPGILDKTYAFLNIGYSDTSLFPELRYAAEVYHNFPHGWEGSLGFRRLEFDTSAVTIYTGTLAKYFGSNWLSLRPNYVDKQDGSSSSLGLTWRHYFLGRYEYFELGVRGGNSDIPDAIITDPTDRLDSFSVRSELRRRVSHRVVMKGVAGYRSEDLESGRERNSWFAGLGIERFF